MDYRANLKRRWRNVNLKNLKTMFGLFKKDPVKKLSAQYKKLMAESHQLSTVDRAKSDQKFAEAEEIAKQIKKLTR